MTGLYIHLPFCSALCPYCDFAVVVGRAETHERYAAALLEEADAAGDWPAFDTLFVGGGTPTFMEAGVVARVLDGLRARFALADEAEVSIEANPESVTAEGMRALAAAGVNRVSIGAQSFREHVLRALGRTHTKEDIPNAAETVRAAGIGNINIDLIFGGPGETDVDWAASLAAAVALEPTHVSCYALTIEERTPFGSAVARGAMAPPDDDALADRYERAGEVLARAGYDQYEISNWALPGYACRHNLATWRQDNYLGLGLGAHSHRDGVRWWNTRSLARYLADPARARDGEEHLGEAARAEEWISLRVRLSEGFDPIEGSARLGRDLTHVLATLVETGLVERHDGRVRLTERGRLLDNEVTRRLLETPVVQQSP